MNTAPVIGFVCEGVTDLPILQSVVDAVIGKDYVTRTIRPETHALAPRSGWTEVQSWCERNGPTLADQLTYSNIDILIVHVDADIASQVRASETSGICAAVKHWLDRGASDRRLVIVIPAQASEAWLLAAHTATTPQLESEADPARQLVARRLISANEKGQPVKDLKIYESLAPKITQRVADLRRILVELERFASKLEAVARDQLGRSVPAPADRGRRAARGRKRPR
jgi:hypothetical protein